MNVRIIAAAYSVLIWLFFCGHTGAAQTDFDSGGDFGTAKNIILMISDGQGIGTVMATDFFNGYPADYELFPVKCFMTTYSSIGSYDPDTAWVSFAMQELNPTDSAAAATAMAAGVKTLPGVIGKDPLLRPLKNIVETASKLGRATGVVTSVQISHATPAGMAAHSTSRASYKSIARHMIYDSELDVIMGCGHPLYDADGLSRDPADAEYKYVGGASVFADLTDGDGALARDGRCFTFVADTASFEALAAGELIADKVFGVARVAETLQQDRSGGCALPFSAACPMTESVPTLALMTQGALAVLSQEDDGFFLMVEGGAVDWANHDNDGVRLIEEQTGFNNAVAAVVAWVTDETNGSSWDDTLVIVTADHGCGYIWGTEKESFILPQDNGPGVMPQMVYHHFSHTNMPVPLYAKGAGVELLQLLVDGRDSFFADLISEFDSDFDGSYVDNTDVFTVMDRAMTKEYEKGQGGVWLKGDLHAHSLHSDGDSPVADVLASATDKGLDFFALTDHDSDMLTAGIASPLYAPHWSDPDYTSEELILLYGVEWTSDRGHANVWAAEPFDYARLWKANNRSANNGTKKPDPYLAITAAHEQEALFSINHPGAYFCCPWELTVENSLDAIEVWNALYRLPNLNFLASNSFWDRQLIQGRRMTGVGGSDTHNLNGIQAWAFGHGNPTTWVYAHDRSGEAVVEAIRQGRVTISWAPAAPRVELSADTNGDRVYETMMGDNVLYTGGGPLKLRISVGTEGGQAAGRADARILPVAERLIRQLSNPNADSDAVLEALLCRNCSLICLRKNGIIYRAWVLDGAAGSVTVSDVPHSIGHTFYRAELIGRPDVPAATSLLYGRMKAMTNPIYINYPQR